MYRLIIILSLIATLMQQSDGYSSGAPPEACSTLQPDHGTTSQPVETNPYELDIEELLAPSSVYQYVPGVTYTVILQANKSNVVSFKGFLIQARKIRFPDNVTGIFNSSNTNEFGFQSCDQAQYPLGSAVTHVNGSSKMNVTFKWTAPPKGSGPVYFVYTVVQSMQIFWADLRTPEINEHPCEPPEYLLTAHCTDVCPFGSYGDHTTATCQQWPASSLLVTNATAYYLTLDEADVVVGRGVLNYTVIVNESAFDNIVGIFLTMLQTETIQNIFRYDSGSREKNYPVSSLASLDRQNNFIVIQEQIFLRDTIPVQLFSDNLAIFSLNLNAVVFGSLADSIDVSTDIDTSLFVTITRTSGPCQDVTCFNEGICRALNISGEFNFTCNCHPAYTGQFCETLFDPCVLSLCLNNATCENIGTTNYTCNCTIDFTGENCEIEIDQCSLIQGVCNNGTCIDGFGIFSCDCIDGFIGEFCETEINECVASPSCQNGVCIDDINSFTCDCYPGWFGDFCENDIDYCSFGPAPFGPCSDFGSSACIDGNITFSCTCLTGFTGYTCAVDINECDEFPCLNNATCNNLLNGAYTCDCTPDYTGLNCGIPLFPCNDVPCMNNGTCIDAGLGNGTFSCMCAIGFTGNACQADLGFCTDSTCMNSGVCVEGVGTMTTCECFEGFSGQNCELDLPLCDQDSCHNGGTCIEGIGIHISCNCTINYRGNQCETEICFENSCSFNGNCSETNGEPITCECSEGFNGLRCEIDLDYCQPTTCANEGTCIEGEGSRINCICLDGYSGNVCDQDDSSFFACTSNSCENNGTCVEEFGVMFSCLCLAGFLGSRCETDTLDLCNSVFGISCTKATIGGVVAIAIGAFLLILFLATLMLLLVLWCKLHQKKRICNVAGLPVVGGIMISNPIYESKVEGAQNQDKMISKSAIDGSHGSDATCHILSTGLL
ncbi:fibropellin-1-like isoform X3 [Halichondria panicea]|uniref:fibropellin-1-like isoform X3 n=1 Tax=Halichondria panicea TaxID=6063 RepID=UPI00312B91B9